jgi:hypothetical protein
VGERRLELAAPFDDKKPLFFEKLTRNSPAVVNLSGYPLKGTSETFLPIFSTDERGSTHGRTTGQTTDRRSEFIDVSVKLTLPSVNW